MTPRPDPDPFEGIEQLYAEYRPGYTRDVYTYLTARLNSMTQLASSTWGVVLVRSLFRWHSMSTAWSRWTPSRR